MKFNRLCDLHATGYRNTVGINLAFDEFDDLTDCEDTMAYAQAKSSVAWSNMDLQYHAIDYIFLQPHHFPSRFSDGTYPVWYGCRDVKTSFHETIYHWKRTFIDAPQFIFQNEQVITAHRTVFTVQCNAALIDLRQQVKTNKALTQPDPTQYAATQKIGERICHEGYPGLLTKSARHIEGDNIVVFQKKILSSAQMYKDYCYQYNTMSQAVEILERSGVQS